jgi:hypothetical protein
LKLVSNAIPVGHRLRFIEEIETSCPWCGHHETVFHCFFTCPQLSSFSHVLYSILSTCFASHAPSSTALLFHTLPNPQYDRAWSLLLCTYLHTIWCARSGRLLGDSTVSPVAIPHLILSHFESTVQKLFFNSLRRRHCASGRLLDRLTHTYITSTRLFLPPSPPFQIPILNRSLFGSWTSLSIPPPPSLSLPLAHIRPLPPSAPVPGLSQRPPGVVLAKRRTPPAAAASGGSQRDVSPGPPLGPRAKRLRA